MNALFATIVTVMVLVVLVANYFWLMAQMPRFSLQLDAGIPLSGLVKFLIKLDHFLVKYPYALIPFVWVMAFLAASTWVGLRDSFGRMKAAKAPDGGLGEP